MQAKLTAIADLLHDRELVIGTLQYAASDDVALFAARNQRWAVHRDMTYAYAGNVCFGCVEGRGLRAVFVPVEQWPHEWREPRLLPPDVDGVFSVRADNGEVWVCPGDPRAAQRIWIYIQGRATP